MSKFRISDYDWYCDNCGAHISNQSGFPGSGDTWTCTKCGDENNIGAEDVLDDVGHALEYVFFVHCPNCDAHLVEDGDEMVCPDCSFRCPKSDCEF